jgi:hypothetical protein
MSTTKLTRAAVGAAALASAFTLAACGSGSNAAAPASQPAAPATSATSAAADASDSPASPAKDKPSDKATPRCTTEDLTVSLGAAKPTAQGAQMQLPLQFKNTSTHPCDLHGTPGVDLHGPDHPTYGPVDSLLRRDGGPAHNILAPGRTATAKITALPSDPNPPTESPAWTADSLTTIPPGQTKALHATWPSNLAITRQDGATHPGTWVDPIVAD